MKIYDEIIEKNGSLDNYLWEGFENLKSMIDKKDFPKANVLYKDLAFDLCSVMKERSIDMFEYYDLKEKYFTPEFDHYFMNAILNDMYEQLDMVGKQ